MAAYSVHENLNPETRREVPFLLDVQSEVLSLLETRVVVPLHRSGVKAAMPIPRLAPSVSFRGQTLVAMVPEMAGILTRYLGPEVGRLEEERPAIMAAVDLILCGF